MNKTNEQILRALLKELSPIETAIIRERIYKMCEITLADIPKWRPNAAFVVSNYTYRQIIVKIQGLLEFKGEEKMHS